jgi:conjugative transfer region lipoprotein (TIGR03751 family)
MRPMKPVKQFTLILISIISMNLNACTSMNQVMPKQGPSMENIYDEVGKSQTLHDTAASKSNIQRSQNPSDLNVVREIVKTTSPSGDFSENPPVKNHWQGFHKELNPTLMLYIYPHLAGDEGLPVPGYRTAFTAYERDHYAFSNNV